MSNIQEFPAAARRMTEFEALAAAAPGVLDAIPGAVHICDKDGWLVRYNREAAQLWARSPVIGEENERFLTGFDMPAQCSGAAVLNR